MCKHNEEDVDCGDCCYTRGYEDATDGEVPNNPYKNWDQSNAYSDGYNEAKADMIRLEALMIMKGQK